MSNEPNIIAGHDAEIEKQEFRKDWIGKISYWIFHHRRWLLVLFILVSLQTRPVQQLDQGTIPQRRRRRGALEIEDTPYLASREYRLSAVGFLIVERRAGRPWVRLGARKTP